MGGRGRRLHAMEPLRHPVILHTRVVLLWYAVAAGVLGLVTVVWGPNLVGAGPAGTGWSDAGMIRLFGAVGVGGACAAVALAKAEDVESRRHALPWFAAGQLVVLLAVFFQPGASEPAYIVGGVFVGGTWVLLYTWRAGDGQVEGVSDRPTTLFGPRGSPSTTRLRSAYERQIRRAAGQEERARLARDLHDSIKQHIFVVQTAAATVEARFDRDTGGAKAALADIRRAAREATAEMDAMLQGLRAAPLENAGLVGALKRQCEALEYRTGATVECSVGTLPPSTAVPPGTHEAVFRVAQEALANVARHARAGQVRVSLGTVSGGLELAIEDDGVGYEPGTVTAGLGLSNMRARAEEVEGTLNVVKRAGGGTTVSLLVPTTTLGPDDVREYRRRAIGWALLLGFLAVVGSSDVDWIMISWLTAMGVIGLGRDLLAYRRAVKAVRSAR